MSDSLTVQLVVTGADIDQTASEAAFRTALLKHIAERDTALEQIKTEVTALFDQFKGQSIPMPALGGMVAQKLNAQPENHKVLSDRAQDYVRDNSQQTGSEKDGTLVEHPDSVFVIAKGKGGGAYRRADRPAPESK